MSYPELIFLFDNEIGGGSGTCAKRHTGLHNAECTYKNIQHYWPTHMKINHPFVCNEISKIFAFQLQASGALLLEVACFCGPIEPNASSAAQVLY